MTSPTILLRTLFRLAVLAAVLLGTQPARAGEAPSTFGLDQVAAIARDLASKPYVDNKGDVPDFLMQIDYDAWRDIRFTPDKSLWRGEKLPFELQFFHPGLYYDRTVQINIIEKDGVHHLDFDPAFFNYGKNTFADKIPAKMGYAGFRVHAPIKKKNYYDEFLVFLGASYFRGIGKNQNYGLSARALAVDTAEPSGEEFPYFKEFWIQKPGKKDKAVTIYALLDSKRVTGAYKFVTTPGAETLTEVESVVFLREPVKKLGVAPLTSMFIFGENSNPRMVDDFRPEVHDSDGLQINFESGEWFWRPLQNPKTLLVNAFGAPNPKGFGLMQRDLDYHNYLDLEVRYDERPSAWIEPKGQWGQGRIELVQIPTPEEIHDNIVTYWLPETYAPVGEPMRYDYTLRWTTPGKALPPAGYVVGSYTGKSQLENSRLFVIEFEGGKLKDLPEDAAVNAQVWIGQGGRLKGKHVMKNPVTGGWRLFFDVEPDSSSALGSILPEKRPLVEMRAYLQHGMTALTETWSYAIKL